MIHPRHSQWNLPTTTTSIQVQMTSDFNLYDLAFLILWIHELYTWRIYHSRFLLQVAIKRYVINALYSFLPNMGSFLKWTSLTVPHSRQTYITFLRWFFINAAQFIKGFPEGSIFDSLCNWRPSKSTSESLILTRMLLNLAYWSLIIHIVQKEKASYLVTCK